ncbi:MAG TPA: helicase HerA-like domain-containing protein [Hyphomonadaceae bacterium]|nr:helicase HerA-like domain-containing protein [Hyphomonadaceae bacterium]
MTDSIFIGGGGPDHKSAQTLLLARANRHGLVAGATGTGKTVTLQTMAEQFAAAGVPVFAADVKGDLSGICTPGNPDPKLLEKLNARAADIGMSQITFSAQPCIFWDIYGKRGHPIRATVSEMGPQLIARLLQLNDTQEGVVTIAFQYADDNNLLLLDFKDLRALLADISKNAAKIQQTYGNVAAASVGAVQRQLLLLEREGAPQFFGEPALELRDFMRTTTDGRGYVNILDATTLINSPRLYATFLLWLMSELFEQLPEVGDPDKPKLVFFFDEAHLLFNDAPKALVDKIEQVVRLIRSKGVGIYFVTQNPRDLPETVLAQLGCRIQHALRAYTPGERKAVKAAAESFRVNPAFDTATVINELGTGEALVSTLDIKGTPTVVERTLIRPPSSRLGPATDAERAAIQTQSPVAMKYDTPIDRESAYESLTAREVQATRDQQALEAREKAEAEAARARKIAAQQAPSPQPKPRAAPRSRAQTPMEAATNTIMRTAGRELTQFVFRGIFGGRRR